MSGDTSEAKTKPASQQKLRKQREKGQVPQTRKMVSLATTALGLIATLALLPGILRKLAEFFETAFRQMATPLSQARTPIVNGLAETLFFATAPIFVAVTASAIALTVIYHKGIPFSVKPLTPDFGKLNPAKGLTQMFGKRTWIEVGIGLVQIILWAGLSGLIMWGMLRPMLSFHTCGLPCAAAAAETVGRRLTYAAIGFCFLMIGLDMLVQRYLYAQEQRMTKSEVKREQKENFGSQALRSARYRLKQEALMESDAPRYIGAGKANMCFFTADNAVGLLYHPNDCPIPRVTVIANGGDASLALRKEIGDAGWRELEDASVTNRCIKLRPGVPVPESAYTDLSNGINKMYS